MFKVKERLQKEGPGVVTYGEEKKGTLLCLITSLNASLNEWLLLGKVLSRKLCM